MRAVREMPSKRGQARRAHESKAVLEVLSVPAGQPVSQTRIECRTTDVSEGGVRVTVVSFSLLPTGSRVRLRFKTGRWFGSLALVGEVRWSRLEQALGVYVIGMQFKESDIKAKEKWLEYLQQSVREPAS